MHIVSLAPICLASIDVSDLAGVAELIGEHRNVWGISNQITPPF